MAQDINVLTVTGRVGTDPEIRGVGKTELGTFRLAVSVYAGKGDEETVWLTVNVWGNRSAVCEYISKGDKLAISGELRINEWENDEGEERRDVVLNAHQISFMSGGGDDDDRPKRKGKGKSKRRDDDDEPKNGKKKGAKKGGKKSSSTKSYGGDDDDLPF